MVELLSAMCKVLGPSLALKKRSQKLLKSFSTVGEMSTPLDTSSVRANHTWPRLLTSISPLPSEEVAEGKSAILIGMSQWSSNDLVEQIETMGKLEEHQGEPLPLPRLTVHVCLTGYGWGWRLPLVPGTYKTL